MPFFKKQVCRERNEKRRISLWKTGRGGDREVCRDDGFVIGFGTVFFVMLFVLFYRIASWS